MIEPQLNRPRVHRLVLRVPPDRSAAGIPSAAWASAIGPVAAWPQWEATQAFLERRIFRTKRRGRLEEVIVAGLHDALGLVSPQQGSGELRELVRPLTDARALPVAGTALREALRCPVVAYAAELAHVDEALPEGPAAFAPLFTQLVEGLAALDGPVGLSMLALPPLVRLNAEEEGAPPIRRLRFVLRLFAAAPIPATLRARAEVLCRARTAVEGDWRLALTPQRAAAARAAIATQRPIEETAIPNSPSLIAALTLALPMPADPSAKLALGRPVSGPLSKDGPALGRVPRPDGRLRAWHLSWEQRRLHTFIAGASGCGKTTTMLRLGLDDIQAGRSVVLIDFHGDVGDQFAAAAPAARLLHVDPRRADTAPLDLLDPDPARASAHLLSAVTEVWPADYSGPMWQRSVSLGCRALVATTALNRRPTLADLERFVVDPDFRERVIDGIADPRLAAELRREHAAWKAQPRDDSSMVGWISSKLTPLTQGPARSLFTAAAPQPLEAVVAGGKVLVVTLPVGALGQATAGLAARMFLTRLTAAIAAQGNRPEAERRPVSVFVDEAHMATGQALAGLFAQARKFNCSVTVACQSPSQLQPQLEQVLTNAQTHLYGRLSQREAMHLAARIGEQGVRALPRLPRHHLVAALEDNDPDLAPLILAPVPPPALPELEPAPVAVHEDEPDFEEFDSVLASIFSRGRGD